MQAARVSGIDVKWHLVKVYAIAGLLSGLAGVVQIARAGSGQAGAGLGYELQAIAAVVIGGLGSLWGTLVGGIVLGVAQQIGSQINISYQLLAGYLVFLVVLVIRPQGLTARRSQS